MSEFQPFLMERFMSKYEQQVAYNLSESGVHPLTVGELLAGDMEFVMRLSNTSLNYPHVNGTPELREKIAALYHGASAENVLVTVGAIEANYISVRTLLTAGDEIAIMLPNYMQIWGIAKNHGYRIKTVHLQEEHNWALDLDELQQNITPKTKLIAICNPNNPTGYILTAKEMEAIIAAAERVGAWILADEVYRGTERLTDEETPSFYGRYDKVLATGSLSKAYGLPGLRLGWIVAPGDTLDDIWARHEYVTISATKISNLLAEYALTPETRKRVLQRTRSYIRQGFPVLEHWLNRCQGLFSLNPPPASAIAFLRYHLAMNSSAFVEQLRQQKSVLLVPGDHFGIDYHLRLNFGLPTSYLLPALDRIQELIKDKNLSAV